jgi:glycerol kinase
MKPSYILAIDQGTTGSRAFIFDSNGKIVGSGYKEFRQYFPKPGWVEHDADEIWTSCVSVIKQAMAKAKISPTGLAAIGVTNQRETTVMWDRKTSKPVARAIVWQCRRTSEFCKRKDLQAHKDKFRYKTGLVLDPYFSGTKVRWFLDHVPGLRQKSQNGQIAFGTIDSWLIWKLTSGQSHVTDMTNASRTLLFNIRELKWDKELLNILKIPSNILPEVKESGSIFGRTASLQFLPGGIPIAGVLGDQQAALYGQGCFKEGSVKNTYGTGCFIVLNTGKKLIYSKNGLLSTIASDERGKPVYAMEGSVFIAGAVIQWLRDQLKIVAKAKETEQAVRGISDTGGVYFVPAFAGLGAPHWNSEARGMITGLTRGTTRAHIIRAALESMAYQTKDVFDLMKKETGKNIKELRVDGGACQNNMLMQFQADILSCKILRPAMIDSTVKGAALLAGRTISLWKQDLANLNKVDRTFTPKMKAPLSRQLYSGWQKAVRQTQTT